MIEKIRKAGIITKGVLYAMVGILTLMAAINAGGQIAGKNAVINYLQNQTFGQILVVILSIGLIFYALWRLSSAFLDTKGEGSDNKAYLKRTGYFISGLIYGSLGVSTLISTLGSSSGSSGNKKESIVASVLNLSYGQTILYVVAAIFLGVGFYQFYKGFKKKFLEDIDNRGSVESDTVLENSGRIGFIARGISFAIFAWFIYRASSENNADAVRGIEGMFSYLNQLSYGTIIMALMAIGFIAYGVYQYFLARYSNLYSNPARSYA